jgi:hypothetical protein
MDVDPGDADPPAAAERAGLAGVLELRIHGVNNTSPASMLDLPAEDVERVVGDDLAAFWREKDGAQAGLQRGDRGWRDPDVVREAYSWGGLARNTPDGTGGGVRSAIVRGSARIGWALLLPFGLANIAYWSRRLRTDPGAADPSLEGAGGAGRGAGGMRVFALGLTTLLVATACEVGMDLIATQCYRDEVPRCPRLPGLFDGIGRHVPAVRLVLASTPALTLLAVLWVLSSVTRSAYERPVSECAGAPQVAPGRRPVLLAVPRFWAGDVMVGRLARHHLTVGISAVAVALAWPGTFGGGVACRDPGRLLDRACWDQVRSLDGRAHGWLLACVVLGFVTAGLAATHACLRADDAPDVRPRARGRDVDWSRRLLPAAVANLLLAMAALTLGHPYIDDDLPAVGVGAGPTLVLAVLVSLALGGLTWRRGPYGPIATLVFGSAVLAGGIDRRWFWLAAAAVVWVLGRLPWRLAGPHTQERAHVAWRGTGPGVLMGISLVAAMTMSALVTLTFGDWLNGANAAADLVAGPRPGVLQSSAAPHLVAASPYVLFGVAVLVTLVLVVVLLVAVGVRAFVGPAPAPPAGTEAGNGKRERSRRLAAAAHRAERVLGGFAFFGLTCATVVLVLSAGGWPQDGLATTGWEGFARRLIDLGVGAAALAGLIVLAALIGGSARGTRPLGLIWDLVCFLPRAAHPFAPPCYAERAVPELVDRCAWWLTTDSPQGPGRTRRGDRIVLSAHSLGAALAVAAILAMPAEVIDPPGRRPIRLLTYGCQLRAYFGRIFPELLGPQVLGTPPVGAALLWTADPWARELDKEGPPPDPSADSVLTRLGGTATRPPLWRSLWRRTDYLGFPVRAYTPNDIDVPAEEVDTTAYLVTVVTHSNYPRAVAYAETFDALALVPVQWPGDEPAASS